MRYIDVRWRHGNVDEPVRLVSELDERRMDLRKLEFFRDGAVGAAWIAGATCSTELGIEPIPPLDEINASPEFLGVEIDAETFERLWAQAGL
jgi:hypothetical protein